MVCSGNMVERRVCSFCGNEIEPGTGKMYVRLDGTIYNFCRNKCQKNQIELHRIARRTRWTQPYIREKSAKTPTKGKKASKRKKGKTSKEGKPPSKKVSKTKSKDEAGNKKKGATKIKK